MVFYGSICYPTILIIFCQNVMRLTCSFHFTSYLDMNLVQNVMESDTVCGGSCSISILLSSFSNATYHIAQNSGGRKLCKFSELNVIDQYLTQPNFCLEKYMLSHISIALLKFLQCMTEKLDLPGSMSEWQ